MKIRSTRPLPYDADRLGIKYGIIEIDLTVVSKDDIGKTYSLKAIDYVVDESETSFAGIGMYATKGRRYITEKMYTKTYAEYDAQKVYLKSLDSSGLTGSELDDKLLQDALLYSAMTDTVYESTHEDWEAYSDPIVIVAPPVLDDSDGKMISGSAGAGIAVVIEIVQGTETTQHTHTTSLSGQFAHITYPVLLPGTVITAVAVNLDGIRSAVSNTVIVETVSEEAPV